MIHPYFETIKSFISMGGYAKYVWSAYGVGAVIIALNILVPVYLSKRFKRGQRSNEPAS